jgi:hypothetical protein
MRHDQPLRLLGVPEKGQRTPPTDRQLGGPGSSKVNVCSRKEVKPIGSVFIPHVKGISKKFRCIRYRYNIRKIFKTRHTLRSILVRIRPERVLQSTAYCVYGIPCECGRYRKYKEAAHTACWTDPFSQPSLEVSSICFPLTEKRSTGSFWCSYQVSS